MIEDLINNKENSRSILIIGKFEIIFKYQYKVLFYFDLIQTKITLRMMPFLFCSHF
jgi:hypothetical protein